MKRIVRLRIDELQLDRHAAGLTGRLQDDLSAALRQALTARLQSTSPDWPATTPPALQQAAVHLAARLPLPSKEADK